MSTTIPTGAIPTGTEPQSTTQAGTRPFVVLCVCEGNVCRSPVAAVLLQQALGPDVEVTSAGTRAVVGAPVAPLMETLLRGGSLSGAGLHARQLRPEHVRAADLVLTMTRRQRGAVARLVPAAVRRTFGLRELARLLADAGPGALGPGPVVRRLAWAVPTAGAQRRYVADPEGDDVVDPYGRDEVAYRRAYDEIAAAVDRIGEVLVGRSPTPYGVG